MRPKWQKARIITTISDEQFLLHRVLWVTGTVMEPDYLPHSTPRGGPPCIVTERSIYTNVFNKDQQQSACISRLELLPEFADDVPMVSWNDFVAGKV